MTNFIWTIKLIQVRTTHMKSMKPLLRKQKTVGSRCNDSPNCKVTESTVCLVLTSTDVLMHDKTNEELSTNEYPETSADNGQSTNVTSTESTVQITEISNDVGSWKSLSASERDSVVKMGPKLPPKSLRKDSKGRSFPMSIFSKIMPNGETMARDWLYAAKRHKAFSVSVVAYSRANLHLQCNSNSRLLPFEPLYCIV